MLNDVVEHYLDSLQEREFDAPFIALLRALGYSDIHFLHGAFEFGKDFIAKARVEGSETQFAFQTKAGDINRTTWDAARGQIDMLRTDAIAHPSFDTTLPRKAVFVTTGRLVGAAPAAAQNYRDHLARMGEITFTTWDKQDLIQSITTDPRILLASDANGAFLTCISHDTICVTGHGAGVAGFLGPGMVAEPILRRWLAALGGQQCLQMESRDIFAHLACGFRQRSATPLALIRDLKFYLSRRWLFQQRRFVHTC